MLVSPVEPDLLTLTTQIVAAYVARNAIPTSDVTLLIERTHRTLAGLASGGETGPIAAPVPAVPVKKSVFPDFIVCLDDGKELKMLKRHLATRYGMTPQQYRDKWHLPKEYPMVAPNYAKRRSAIAKKLGLGHNRKVAPLQEPIAAEPARRRSSKQIAAES